MTSLTLATKASGATSQPTSVTSKPAAESIEQTIVLPISWMSPATVPATAMPVALRPSLEASRAGCSTLTAAFMASAPWTSSGRKNSPRPKRSPTSSMPLTKPLSRMSAAREAHVEALLGERGGGVVLAVDHCLRHLGVDFLGHQVLLRTLLPSSETFLHRGARSRAPARSLLQDAPEQPPLPAWTRAQATEGDGALQPDRSAGGWPERRRRLARPRRPRGARARRRARRRDPGCALSLARP